VERSRPAHFPLFDSLRAIAALTVFVIHDIYQVAVNRPENHAWYRFGVHLDVAVPIFFAVSGFLLYRPFLAASLAGRPLSVRAYLWRRALRIVPAYWVALAIITVWFDLREVQSVSGALRFGGFAQIYSDWSALRGVGQAWTLDVEVAFYVFLPVFALWLCRARTVRAALTGVLALIAFSVAWKAFALVQTDAQRLDSAPWLYPLPAQLDQLGAGMLLAVLSLVEDVDERPLVRLVVRRPGIAWLLAFAVWVLDSLLTESGQHFGARISDPQYLVKHELYAGFVFLLLAPAVFGDRAGGGLTRRVLRWRPLLWVGTISYSFYLWHYAVIAQFERWWGRFPHGAGWALWFAETLAGSLVLGAAGFYLIERPFMRLKSRVPAGPRAAQAEAAQARAAP
jgi:peptidoglycan/LPS O-acetylase OafA/YrhL